MLKTAVHPLVVVMGISGSGKSTVGAALARRLDVPYADADDFHSAANIAKMSSKIPLDDTDRMPWLHAIANWLGRHVDSGAVVSCSALKRRYRDVLRSGAPGVEFLHLSGDPEVARRRVGHRQGHFMPAALIDSQQATLEPLDPDEQGVVLDFADSVDQIVSAYADRL